MSNLELNINNFQIIKNAQLTFPERVISLIVGRSGSGKTSILRAIRTLILNTNGAQKFIKHGENECKVKMLYNNNEIEWRRTKSSSFYNINGQEYTKIGTGNLTTLLNNSGFILDNKNDILNIEGAWQVLFPYDKSDAELFKLFESTFCVSDSGKIFQSFKQEEDKLNKELQENINILNKNNLKIKTIEDLQNKVSIEDLKKRKENFIIINNNYSNLFNDIKELKVISKYTNIIVEDIKIKYFNKNLLNDYENIYLDLVKVRDNIDYVKLVIKYGIKTKNFTESLLNEYKNLRDNVITLKNVIEYQKITPKSVKVFNEDLLNEYKNLKNDIVTLKSIINYPQAKEEIKTFNTDNLMQYNNIKKDLNKIKELIIELKEMKKQKEDIEQQLNKYNEELSKIKTCELCGNPISFN